MACLKRIQSYRSFAEENGNVGAMEAFDRHLGELHGEETTQDN